MAKECYGFAKDPTIRFLLLSFLPKCGCLKWKHPGLAIFLFVMQHWNPFAMGILAIGAWEIQPHQGNAFPFLHFTNGEEHAAVHEFLPSLERGMDMKEVVVHTWAG